MAAKRFPPLPSARPPAPHHAPNQGARPRAIHVGDSHTTYTAVAPKAVFTMRTLATRAAPAPEFNAQTPTAHTEKQQLNPLATTANPQTRAKSGGDRNSHLFNTHRYQSKGSELFGATSEFNIQAVTMPAIGTTRTAGSVGHKRRSHQPLAR